MKEFLIGLIIGIISGMVIGIVNMCILIVGKDGDIDGWFKEWVNRPIRGNAICIRFIANGRKTISNSNK